MIVNSVWAAMRRKMREDEAAENSELPATSFDHDPVMRLALLGIFFILFTAALSVTRVISLPIVAGLVFGLVFGPLAERLVRLGIPQSGAAALIVGSGVLFFSFIIAAFATPFALWSDRLPTIVDALKAKIHFLLLYFRQLQGIAKDITPDAAGQVAIAEKNPWFDIAMGSSAAAGAFLIFVATVYFYLSTRRHLKARALRLCLGRNSRFTAGAFFEQIENKVASYFFILTLINLVFGIITALIALAAGLPFAIFWGVVAFLLNYIAFVGPFILAILLLGAGLLTDQTVWGTIWPSLAYFIVHLFEANVITPILVGRQFTVSPFLIFVSFVFWLWLWGPVGAILSTPMLLLATLAIEAIGTYKLLENAQAPLAVNTQAVG